MKKKKNPQKPTQNDHTSSLYQKTHAAFLNKMLGHNCSALPLIQSYSFLVLLTFLVMQLL